MDNLGHREEKFVSKYCNYVRVISLRLLCHNKVANVDYLNNSKQDAF